MKIADRLRGYLYKAGLRVVPVDDLANISARLGELGRYAHELARAVIEAPAVVTVIVFGYRDGQTHMVERERRDSEPVLVVVDSATRAVKYDQTETIELRANFPVRDFQVVVLADLQRLDEIKIFHGPNLMAWTSPVGFGSELQVGEIVRVICRTRGRSSS
jgi:hypothetical protein